MDNIKEISPTEVKNKIKNNDSTILIDVREDKEIAIGMIPEAIHIPLNKIPEVTTKLDKDKNYILVCRSGVRSLNAALYMKEQGYNVSNMVGGMLDWDGEII